MLVVVSPSKSVMKQDQPDGLEMTVPLFPDMTAKLVSKLQNQSRSRIKRTLEVSESLAELNYNRFQTWHGTPKRAALWMYSGDVYNGIDAYSMPQSTIDFAQNNLLIVSGLYGLIRPLDAIQPYRLEMKLPFAAGKAKNLYEYWQQSVTDTLARLKPPVILLCASKEYAKAITAPAPNSSRLITPRFMQDTGAGLKEKGLFAKYSRGALARWVLDNQVSDPEDLKNYHEDGFMFSEDLSSIDEFVYIIPSGFSLKGRFTKK